MFDDRTAELVQAIRIKDQFLTTMSHELRTPLNAIVGFSQLITETDMDREQRDYVDSINESARALLSMITDILDIAQFELAANQPKITNFSLYSIVGNLKQTFGVRALEKNLKLHSSIDRAVPEYLRGDLSNLRRILANLIDNAIKFTDHGVVSFRVGVERESHADVLLRFVVRDSGIGIPADQLESIFSTFYQIDSSLTRRFDGAGTGLAIVRLVVELLGGKVEVRSKVGHGSTFEAILPFEKTEDPGLQTTPGGV